VSSPAVPVPVAVKATLTVPPNGVAAGDCGTLKAAVQPPQPGTPVTFQRLIGSTWIPEATSNLGNGTPAAAQVCERWGDLGTQSWRAVWDPSGTSQNAPGTPPTAALRVVNSNHSNAAVLPRVAKEVLTPAPVYAGEAEIGHV